MNRPFKPHLRVRHKRREGKDVLEITVGILVRQTVVHYNNNNNNNSNNKGGRGVEM